MPLIEKWWQGVRLGHCSAHNGTRRYKATICYIGNDTVFQHWPVHLDQHIVVVGEPLLQDW